MVACDKIEVVWMNKCMSCISPNKIYSAQLCPFFAGTSLIGAKHIQRWRADGAELLPSES